MPASVSPPGAVLLRRCGRLRQRAEAEGRALRAALGDAGRRDDLRTLQAAPTWPRPARSRSTTAGARESRSGRDLHRVRNMRQAFHHGLIVGGALAGTMDVTRGALPGRRFRIERDAEAARVRRAATLPGARRHADLRQALERVSVGATARATTSPTTSASRTRAARGRPTRGRTCARPRSTRSPASDDDGIVELEVTPSNCVQCGAITAKGGRLTPPEGGRARSTRTSNPRE